LERIFVDKIDAAKACFQRILESIEITKKIRRVRTSKVGEGHLPVDAERLDRLQDSALAVRRGLQEPTL
jgi:hypothetical protein